MEATPGVTAASPQVQKVMPNDSFYFSIVRDPAMLAESAFAYYRAVAPAFRRAPSLASFVASPGRFYQPGLRGNHYARNLLWFDFGLPPVAPGDRRAVAEAVAEVERAFAMVLLAEHFDESLVLLREALCWPEEAVASFPHNGRPRGAVPRLSPGQLARLRAWNALDWALYGHLNRSFWRRAAAFGSARMAAEVARLRRRREALARRCFRGGGPLPGPAIADGRLRPFQPARGGAAILGYALKAGLEAGEREACARMATPELQYKDILDRRQFGGGNGSAG